MEERRGSIGFFTTYRPPQPLDLYSYPINAPKSGQNEHHLTDGQSYNYNANQIPPATLKTMLKYTKLGSHATEADVDSGRVVAMIFVSERFLGLELLHVALRFLYVKDHPLVMVFKFTELYDGGFDGIRMEDSGCFAGDYLVYVSTVTAEGNPPPKRRQPWTAVYKTSLITGKTQRLTPLGEADLSPSVSPDGKKIAVASFQGKEKGWDGEIENLQTNIFVMNVEEPYNRTPVIVDGGWPTWGSDDILFFHRNYTPASGSTDTFWGVFKTSVSNSNVVTLMSPPGIDAMTPAAIDANTVIAATIREKSGFSPPRERPDQYRHIEIFHTDDEPQRITVNVKPRSDHFNPFLTVENGDMRIGYHRGKIVLQDPKIISCQELTPIAPPIPDVGLYRVSGAFPSFSRDGSKLAFVDNEFKAVWVAIREKPLQIVYDSGKSDSVFSPIWSNNPDKDILYVCMGPSFHAKDPVKICAILDASSSNPKPPQEITTDAFGAFNNAFPSTNPEGTRLVFRSTKDGGDKLNKNLFIMEDADQPDMSSRMIIRLTRGEWTDTHCSWSPNGDWIVFTSTRDKPADAPISDNGLDPGYFAVYLIKANDPSVVVRVVRSGDDFSGHITHPFFSPDGRSIVVAADLAGVSVDPISLPLFVHSVRPYGDIFTVDIDTEDMYKNQDVEKFNRFTHSKYENSTCTWSVYLSELPRGWFDLNLDRPYAPACPYAYSNGAESWQMSGHLCIPKRIC